MRDLVFKNLVSEEKKRRVISTSEVVDKEGVRSVIHRHFAYMLRELSQKDAAAQPAPYLYILKERNDQEQKERFFCRIKGSVYVVTHGKTYLVLFMHSLKITFLTLPIIAS